MATGRTAVAQRKDARTRPPRRSAGASADATKGLSPATVHLVIRTLSVALNAAVAERAILDNATVGVRLPRIERQPVRPLTHDDAADILVAVTGHWLELPVRVLLGSGLRLGELVGLDQGDLMLEAGFVRVRRT